MSIKNVYYEITSFENLLRADKNCASQHTDKWEIIEFRRNLEENLLNLRDRLRRLDIPPVRYRSFLVFDPKVRKVIYTDYTTKVIQRAIYDVLYEPIQRGFITDTYACVTDRGQHEAVRRLASWFHEFNGRGQYAYYYKFDVRKFFYRIDHEVLMNIIKKKISDKYTVELMRYYMCSTQRPFGMPLDGNHLTITDDEMLWDKGIAIGGGLSHMIGNMYLDQLDQYAKRTLGIKKYIRFADDIIITDTDKGKLKEYGKLLTQFLNEKLLLEFNDRCALRPNRCGCEFVGCVIYPDHVLLRKSTTLRMKKNLRRVAENTKNMRYPSITASRWQPATQECLSMLMETALRINCGKILYSHTIWRNSMGKNDLELLEIYMDMVEKQDEIIYRMTALLKSYVREIHNLRTINGFFEVDSNQEIDEKILEECMDQYEEMKE